MLIAKYAQISEPFLSLILSGRRTPSWRVAKRIAAATGTDRDIWMDQDMTSICHYMDRLDRLSLIGRMADITDARFIEILSRTSDWTLAEAIRLANATLTDIDLWTQNDLHTVMHTLEEMRYQDYPTQQTSAAM